MALYHTYRPRTFRAVIGQEHIVKTLAEQVRSGRLGHAYLFSGSRGVGKTTLARILAKAANCASRSAGESEPCDECASCRDIGAGKALDVVEMDAASHTGVDDVRETILERAHFQPAASRYKIFIIDEAHMLSNSAFNALLKIVEEPPPHLIFILATTEIRKMPETIVSRCQRYVFQKLQMHALREHIRAVAKQENVSLDDAILEQIARQSDGCARDALSLLDQLMATGEERLTAETSSFLLPVTPANALSSLLSALLAKNAPSALQTLRELTESGAHLTQCATDLIERLRLLLLLKSGLSPDRLGADLSDAAIAELRSAGANLETRAVLDLIDIILRRRLEIKSSPIPSLPLELATVEWCAPSALPLPAINSAPETETPPSIISPVSPAPSTNPDISAIRSAWPQFLAAVEANTPSLLSILKMTEIAGLEGRTVIGSVPFSFHRDKLMTISCRKKLEEGLSSILGSPILLDFRVANENALAPDPELSAVAALLGGEVVAI